MKFADFAARADTIEAEPADLATVGLVADLLADADADLQTVTRFLLGRVFPAWDSRKLDVGPATCYAAIARAAGPNVTPDDVEERLADTGEIGAVAASYDFGGQRGLTAFGDGDAGSLTVAEVDTTLRELAAVEGDGSEDRKLDTLFGLFNRADPPEAKYLARLVLAEMRIGVGEGTVRDAIAKAFLEPVDDDVTTDDDPETAADPPIAADTIEDGSDPIADVERALQVTNDYGHVAVLAREEGRDGLRAEGLEVGRPVQAMLAQAGTAAEALEEWEEVGVETKYDGARVQIHYDPTRNGRSANGRETEPTDHSAAEPTGPAVYSRNMEDVTAALPEIVEHVEREVDVPVILDGEVVAVDDAGEPLPFQEVLRRFRRKHDVERMREAVSLELRAFDCLHAAGDDLLAEPFRERHARLAATLETAIAELEITGDPDEIASLEESALEAGHEGIMLKDPDAAYTPGDRGKRWLKRKPDVETLDLVVTGAEWGEGRRANLLGTFLLSVRNGEEYETIGKVATGITDDQLEELSALLEPEIVSEDGQTVAIRPSVVFEVGYEEIQESSTYTSGYALRFPRFIGVRDDKAPAEADSLERVERLVDRT